MSPSPDKSCGSTRKSHSPQQGKILLVSRCNEGAIIIVTVYPDSPFHQQISKALAGKVRVCLPKTFPESTPPKFCRGEQPHLERWMYRLKAREMTAYPCDLQSHAPALRPCCPALSCPSRASSGTTSLQHPPPRRSSHCTKTWPHTQDLEGSSIALSFL